MLPAAALSIALLGAITGCSTGTGGGVSENGCLAPGSASDAIAVDGEFGTELTLESDTPIDADALQRTVLEQGEGDPLADGDTFVGFLNIWVGSSGESYFHDAARLDMSADGLAPWYHSMLTCASAGDRIAAAVPAVDLLGEGGGEPAGISDDDTMLVVLDLRAVLLPGAGRAMGAEQSLPAGFPALSLAENGEPTLTMTPETVAATEPRAAASIVGEGPAVSATDTVLAHYRGVIARTGEIFDDSWATGAPVSLPLDAVVPGVRDGLVGQTVGSQVVIVVPPGSGYSAEDLERDGYQADDVMVFVVDILDAG